MINKFQAWFRANYVLVERFFIAYQFSLLLWSAWLHDIISMSVAAFFLMHHLYWIHWKRRPPRDDDPDGSPDEPSPFGDAVDRWLKERQHQI